MSQRVFTFLAAAACLAFSNPTADAGKPSGPGKPPADSIVQIALKNQGSFSTLVAAVVKADLVETLSSRGQFTVFAPTNAAFDAAAEAVLGEGSTGLDLVNALDKGALTNILLYHVTRGRRFSNSILSANRVRMVNGGFTRIAFEDGDPLIIGNNSRAGFVSDLINVPASNGVIHTIDFVLLP